MAGKRVGVEIREEVRRPGAEVMVVQVAGRFDAKESDRLCAMVEDAFVCGVRHVVVDGRGVCGAEVGQEWDGCWGLWRVRMRIADASALVIVAVDAEFLWGLARYPWLSVVPDFAAAQQEVLNRGTQQNRHGGRDEI